MICAFTMVVISWDTPDCSCRNPACHVPGLSLTASLSRIAWVRSSTASTWSAWAGVSSADFLASLRSCPAARMSSIADPSAARLVVSVPTEATAACWAAVR
ncbi:hypothetical protein BH10ACT10_BH10ACT10_11430 [soil metagenome]